jgi:hypothetical protein
MAGVTEYARPLRAIGQALERMNIQSFEVEPVGEEFIIRGAVPGASQGWSLYSPRVQSDSRALTQIELRYSLREIDLLEKAGCSRRGDLGKPADASSLSQVLRSIGGYLEQRCAHLLKVTRAVDCVAVEYETSLGSKMTETFALGDLYDLWVRMYLQRQGRTSDR